MSDCEGELTTLNADAWGKVLAGFDDACLEQTYEYAADRAGAERLRHLLVRRSGSIVAAAQFVLLELPLLRTGVAFAKFGPVWRGKAGAPDPSNLAAAADHLRQHLANHPGLMVRLMPPASPGLTALTENTLQAQGFIRTPIEQAERYFVDLSKGLEKLRADLKPKWRYKLKRAEQRGMAVSRSIDANDMAQFAKLYRHTRQRKSFADGPAPDALVALYAKVPLEVKPQVFLCTNDNDIVAAATVATIGDTAVYLYGASDKKGASLDAGYYLHWQVIQWLTTTPCRWYDLGGDCGEPGLRQFKSGLIGKAGLTPSLPGYFDAHASIRGRLAGQLTFGVRDANHAVRQWLAHRFASRNLAR